MVVIILPGWKTHFSLGSTFPAFPFVLWLFLTLNRSCMECKAAWFAPFYRWMAHSCRCIRYLFLYLMIYKRWLLCILLYFFCQLCFGIFPQLSLPMLIFVGWLIWQLLIDGVLLVKFILINCFDLLWGIISFPIHSCELDFSNKSAFSVPEGEVLLLVLSKCVNLVNHCTSHWNATPTVTCDFFPVVKLIKG